PAHRSLALWQWLEGPSSLTRGARHTVALLHVEYRVVAQDRRNRLPPVPRLLAVLLLLVPLPEHDRAAALALLDRAASLHRLLEREEVRGCKAITAEQEDVDAAVSLVRDEIARLSGDGAPRLAPGHSALLQLVK